MAELFVAGIGPVYIDALDIKDAAGNQLDVTGYTVEATARAYYDGGEVLSTWSTAPLPGQGTAIAGGAVVDRVRLVVTAEQSSGWDAMFVVVQAEMISPAGQTSRPIDTVYQIKREAVV
jgi:hypothetical protein